MRLNIAKLKSRLNPARRLRQWVRPLEPDLVFAALAARPGSRVMVDVGAQTGVSLNLFAGAGWQVLTFEPDPNNRKALQARYGHMANVVIRAEAVSDHISQGQQFFTSALSTGIGSLAPFVESHKATATVDTITLESALAQQQITSVDFLKVDTEGFDLFVLKGMPWDRIKPRVVVCEFEDRKSVPLGYTHHDLASLLQSQGYQLIVSEWAPIIQYGTVHRWCRFVNYPTNLLDKNAWGDIIAVRDDADLAAVRAVLQRFERRAKIVRKLLRW